MGVCSSDTAKKPRKQAKLSAGGGGGVSGGGSEASPTSAGRGTIRRSLSMIHAGKISRNYYKCPNAWCLRTIDKSLYTNHRTTCDMERKSLCVKCNVDVPLFEYDEHIKNCHPVQCPTCNEKVIKALLPHCPFVLKQRFPLHTKPTTEEEAALSIQRFFRGMKVTKSWYAIIFRLIWFKIDKWDERGLFKTSGTLDLSLSFPAVGDDFGAALLPPSSPYTAPRDGIEVFPKAAKSPKRSPTKGQRAQSIGSSSTNSPSCAKEREGNPKTQTPSFVTSLSDLDEDDLLTSNRSRIFRKASILARDGVRVADNILPFPEEGFQGFTEEEKMDHVVSLKDVLSYQKLSVTYVISLLNHARAALQLLPNVQQVNVNVGFCIVVGDTHGQMQDVSRIIDDRGMPGPKLKYIFNGDFVDRGSNSCEVLFFILALYLTYPEYVVLNRGNHESFACTDHYGCHEEVLEKYTEAIYELMLDVFDAVPLCSVVNGQVFVVHGGIPRFADCTLREINLIDRLMEIPVSPQNRAEQIFMDLMWSDPDPEPFEAGQSMWEHNSARDAGCKWRLPLTKVFLENNNLKTIVRSHHPPHSGYETLHDNLVATVFSASNYTGVDSNHGAIAVLTQQGVDVKIVYDTWKIYDQLDQTNESNSSSPSSPLSCIDGHGYFARTIQKWTRTAEDAVTTQIREKIFRNLHVLMASFCEVDTTDRGTVWKSEWVGVLSSLISDDVPWFFIRNYLADVEPDTGRIQFAKFIRRHHLPVLQQIFDMWLPHTVKWLAAQCRRHGHEIEFFFDEADSNHSGTVYYTEFFELVTNKLGTLVNKDIVLMLYNAFDPNCSGYCSKLEWVNRFEKSKRHGYILEVENWVGVWEADQRQFIMWDLWLLQRLKKYFRKLPAKAAYRQLDRDHKGYISVDDLRTSIEKMRLGAEGHTEEQKKTVDFRKRVKYRIGDNEELSYVGHLFGISEDTVKKGLKKGQAGVFSMAHIQIWPMSEEQYESFLRRLDYDKDGKVTFLDFEKSLCVQDSHHLDDSGYIRQPSW